MYVCEYVARVGDGRRVHFRGQVRSDFHAVGDVVVFVGGGDNRSKMF